MILPLQEHVLSYSMYLCITGIVFDMYAYLYLITLYMYFASYWRNGKQLYALQKMISLLLLVHGTIMVHTVLPA